ISIARAATNMTAVATRAWVPGCGASSCDRLHFDRDAGVEHHARHLVDVLDAGQVVHVGYFVSVRDGGDPRSHGRIDIGSQKDLAARSLHAHFLTVADAIRAGIIGVEDDVSRTAKEAQRRIQLATLTTRGVTQRSRLPDCGLI